MVLYKLYFLKICCSLICLIVLCEYLLYYFVQLQCSWPPLEPRKEETTPRAVVKVMFIADPHLLGPRWGHWFDKLRREWQMYRAYQTAMTLHKPEVVFILGDLLDEGQLCSQEEFSTYVDRFNSLFYVPEGSSLFIVSGNHDIGFHYRVTPYLQKRFAEAFNAPSARLITFKGIHFVLINSMGLEGDGCFLCRPTELLLTNISEKLKCFKNPTRCPKLTNLEQYSRPIVLQHYPLYRESDEDCDETDESTEDGKRMKFREHWDCLARESTYSLLEMFNPRLAIGGHTHHSCHRYHTRTQTHEYSIPSFSWRNIENPAYALGVFTPDDFAITKCYMLKESTIIGLYLFGIAAVVIYATLSYKKHCRRQRIFKVH